ncbi:uncharacterized protein PHALS_12667 [Plasmopara halstedii]|uniref:Uncharacterized protein n=1 Tax=Plasmopara halstedii TaxID=4781 RepID=A0A0P1AMH5_PLAHL|nr:uncharacterized protein PHALS_12667 [Plasmopara halstedii]CEG42386.1 hypothetical protein PHALS_12667 [Plasmopara halstedii]|eukprot:XP_024578755.1 hypothetical protein PHALS_12667 [Plasmopara halstedii]
MEMFRYQRQPFESIPVMQDVLVAIRETCSGIIFQIHNTKKIFPAVIFRRRVYADSCFGVVSIEWRLTSFKHVAFAPTQELKNLKLWQLWEQFNCKYRALKSQDLARNETVIWTKIHRGCNQCVIERQLTYVLAEKRMRKLGHHLVSHFCPEDATKGFFQEVAGPDDLFIMYTTSGMIADLVMLPNSLFTCWNAYYGVQNPYPNS